MAPVLLALACANQHQSIEYSPVDDQSFEARPAAELSERSAEELDAAGYTQIGFITITRVISVCTETCERVDHEQDTATVLLQEAGQRGGELVVFDRKNETFTRTVVKRGECLEHYSHHQTSPAFVPLGIEGPVVASEPQPMPRPTKVCTRFARVHEHENFAESAGSVWRKAP